MIIPRLHANGKAAVILGAGASRGAYYVDEKVAPKPPLDVDFFHQIQLLSEKKHRQTVRELLAVAREEFGPDLPVTMEQFFTHVEFLDEFHRKLRISRGRQRLAYSKIQQTFRRVLGYLLEASTEGQSCMYHEVLVSALRPGDAILSFNYDTLIDAALRNRGGNRWRAANGYGVSVTAGSASWDSKKLRGKQAADPIKLLKLHGSLNWKLAPDGASIELTTAPYDPKKFLVIPPAWNKPITTHPVFSKVWKAARAALRDASILMVIGYSVPPTDMLSQALLRVEATGPSRRLRHVVLANPTPVARGNMVRLLGGAISKHTRVIWFDTFMDLCEVFVPETGG